MKASLIALALLVPASASAEIYRCMDATGKVSYSLTPPTTPCHASKSMPAVRVTAKSSPADFPRVDPATQRSRDSQRREILESELHTERQLLAKARGDDVAVHQRNIEALHKELSYIR